MLRSGRRSKSADESRPRRRHSSRRRRRRCPESRRPPNCRRASPSPRCGWRPSTRSGPPSGSTSLNLHHQKRKETLRIILRRCWLLQRVSVLTPAATGTDRFLRPHLSEQSLRKIRKTYPHGGGGGGGQGSEICGKERGGS